jgi:predicted transcriptional regulator
MTPKLTAEQRAALIERGSPLAIEDEETHRVYFLVDPAMLESMREESDMAAIRQGIADAEAGRTMSLDDAMHRVEASLKARFSASNTAFVLPKRRSVKSKKQPRGGLNGDHSSRRFAGLASSASISKL